MFVTKTRFNIVKLDLLNAKAELKRSQDLVKKLRTSSLDGVLAALQEINVPKMRKAEIKRRLNEIIANYKQ